MDSVGVHSEKYINKIYITHAEGMWLFIEKHATNYIHPEGMELYVIQSFSPTPSGWDMWR